MNHLQIARELDRNKYVFRQLLSVVDQEKYSWKRSAGKWCLLEVICHLYDEEREDFRARVKHVLDTPGLPMPPIDPQGWVSSRRYMEQDYTRMLDMFLAERDRSVTWLVSLSPAPWHNAYEHPKLGTLTAQMLLNNWLAHDYLHIRQITALKYGYLRENAGTSISYAGDW